MIINIPIVSRGLDNEGNPLSPPKYATSGSAGADICSVERTFVLYPGQSRLVRTGLFVAIPPGFEIQIRPRSGLALKHGITVLNSPGTIDSDYRGEIGVILHNAGTGPFVVENGARIAQMVVAPVVRGNFIPVESLEETDRSACGFGSTGP